MFGRVFMCFMQQLFTQQSARSVFHIFVFYFYSNARWKLMRWVTEADRVTMSGMSTNANSSRTISTFWVRFLSNEAIKKLFQLSSRLARFRRELDKTVDCLNWFVTQIIVLRCINHRPHIRKVAACATHTRTKFLIKRKLMRKLFRRNR